MSLSVLAAIAAFFIVAILVGHFVYQYMTTPGWSLKTGVKDSAHDLWVFFGVVGAGISIAFDHLVSFVGWVSGQSALAAKITDWATQAIPAQAYGAATIIVLMLVAYYHKKESGS